jgi:hypothetical protein
MTRTVQHVRLVPQKAQRVPVAARKRDDQRTAFELLPTAQSRPDFDREGRPVRGTLLGHLDCGGGMRGSPFPSRRESDGIGFSQPS